ncbi:MAG: SCO family protein [Bryobacterales bacterium]|nr:SCO family protein [Bryobacterales bacterium]
MTGRAFSRRAWLLASLLPSCARRAPLPIYNSVPPFTLTNQAGMAFDGALLKGSPWLASFFFASCNGPCPRMNTALFQVQERTYGYKNLKIVSFTVDPEHDTPEVLAAYAKRYKADPARWQLLTGERGTISALARDAFLVGALDTAQSHSTRVMLVDGRSRVRGHFPVNEKEEVDSLLAGIQAVYEEGH